MVLLYFVFRVRNMYRCCIKINTHQFNVLLIIIKKCLNNGYLYIGKNILKNILRKLILPFERITLYQYGFKFVFNLNNVDVFFSITMAV